MALNSARLSERLDEKRLPALPHALLKLLATCDDDRATLNDIAAIIGTDAALASRVLAAARSPLFRIAGEVTGIERALAVLGLETVKSVALAAAVMEVFRNIPPALDMARFWRHSLLTAQISSALAVRMNYAQPSEAYLSGLLHDVGELVMAVQRPEDYRAVVGLEPDEARRATVERTRFGETHADLSARLADAWRLSSFMGDALAFHHEHPARIASSHPLVRIVRLAHTLAAESGAPLADELALCDIGPDQANALRDEAMLKVMDLGDGLGLDLHLAEAQPPQADALGEKRAQLADEVSAITLLSSAREHLAGARSERDVLAALQHTFELLFDLSASAFFMARPDGVLAGHPVTAGDTLIAELMVPPRDDSSAASRAVRDREPVLLADVADPGVAVLDRQVARMLGTYALVFLPLATREQVLGLAVCGVPPEYLPRTRNRLRVLGLFARQAAATLAAGRAEEKIAPPAVSGDNRLAVRRMAHEVNNPLTIMKNYVSLLRMKLTDAHSVQDDLRVMSDEIDRVARIIRDFAQGDAELAAPSAASAGSPAANAAEAAGPDTSASAALDIGTVIGDLLRLVTPTLLAPRGIAAISRLDPTLPALTVNADTLKQALLNIVKNAAEAMDKGGTLTIAVRPIQLDAEVWTEITIADTGPGLPREVQARLFQPVTTLKGGEHQGLGLSIVKTQATRMGGIITVDTTSAGTRFRLLLPARSGGTP